MSLLQQRFFFIRASLAVGEGVWKRVLEPIFAMVLAGGAVLILFLGVNLAEAGAEIRMGLILVQVSVSMVVIFIGSTEIPRDFSTRNVQFFLSKPLGRGGYIFGKFLGLLLLGELIYVIYAACFGAGMGWVVALSMKDWGRILFQGMLQMMVLASLLVFLSVVLPELAATIFSVAFYLAAFLVFIFPSMIRVFAPGLLRPVFLMAYYPLPNWQHFLWPIEAIHAWGFFLRLAAYSVAYSILALLAADFFFRRRDLN